MRKTEPFSKTYSASRLYSKAHIAIKYFSPYLVDCYRSKLINSWSISGAWSMVPSSIKPASRSTTRFDNEMSLFEQAVKSEMTLKQMTNAMVDSERSIELKQLHTWCRLVNRWICPFHLFFMPADGCSGLAPSKHGKSCRSQAARGGAFHRCADPVRSGCPDSQNPALGGANVH